MIRLAVKTHINLFEWQSQPSSGILAVMTSDHFKFLTRVMLVISGTLFNGWAQIPIPDSNNDIVFRVEDAVTHR